VHPTSVTNLVDGLERLGYARRMPHSSDRRTTLAAITESGREVAEAATEALNKLKFGTEPLTKTDLEAITAVLRRQRVAEGDFVPSE
jgi:DNA-binding MarR family transcriptional regulator